VTTRVIRDEHVLSYYDINMTHSYQALNSPTIHAPSHFYYRAKF